MGEANLLTAAAVKALLTRVAEAEARLELHVAGPITAHVPHLVLDEPYLDNDGNRVAPKTLVLASIIVESGGTRSKLAVKVPALEESDTVNLAVHLPDVASAFP